MLAVCLSADDPRKILTTNRLNFSISKDALQGWIRTASQRVADIERLISRISLERANARDLIALKILFDLPKIIKALSGAPNQPIKELGAWKVWWAAVENQWLLCENPPLSIREGMIKSGVSKNWWDNHLSRNASDCKTSKPNGKKPVFPHLKSVLTRFSVIISKFPKQISTRFPTILSENRHWLMVSASLPLS